MEVEITARLVVSGRKMALEIDGKQAFSIDAVTALTALITIAPRETCYVIGKHMLGAIDKKIPSSVLDL